MRSITTICWLALLAGTVLGAHSNRALQDPMNPPSFTTGASELVVLPVTVTTGQGELVPDLTREQFVVLDNNRPQTVTLFSNEDAPVSIAIVVDNSGSMRGRVAQVLAATLVFARSSHPEDELFVFEFNDDVRDVLGGSNVRAEDEDQLESALRTLVPEGQTALYDGLMAALERLDRATHARKIILLMSDGGDNVSRATLDDVLAHARRSNATIYTIGLFQRGARETNPGVLKTLASSTGGARFLPRSPGPMLRACSRIAREIRSGYTFGYVPPERDGRYHTVRVHLEGDGTRGLIVRTRPGYFAAAAP
jgi:Ca-activated chloride channel family protein